VWTLALGGGFDVMSLWKGKLCWAFYCARVGGYVVGCWICGCRGHDLDRFFTVLKKLIQRIE
jgi:hypothetical protein